MPADLLAGLTAAEARDRLESDGYNELPRERRSTPLRLSGGRVGKGHRVRGLWRAGA